MKQKPNYSTLKLTVTVNMMNRDRKTMHGVLFFTDENKADDVIITLMTFAGYEVESVFHTDTNKMVNLYKAE